MKKTVFLLCALVAVGLILSARAVDHKQMGQTVAKTDVEKLTERVDALQAKVKKLEERLDKLEKWKVDPVITIPPLASSPAPQTLAPNLNIDPNRPPNASGEMEFNGLKYYFVPLNSGQN